MVEVRPKITSRRFRAMEMLRADARVSKVLGSDGEYLVPSQPGKGFYRVSTKETLTGRETCTCPDFQDRRVPCKHIELVHLDQQAEKGAEVRASFYDAARESLHPRRNWSVYDRSQTEEYRLFNTLLRDLAIGFAEPPIEPGRAGRKPIPLREQVYCAVQRAFLGFSLRRSQGFRGEAVRNGILTKVPFWAVASRFLCRPDVTEGLQDMLARSAIPLIGLEDRCAVDSTGLRTTRFNYYRKEKYEPGRENVWLKLHALVGIKTHAIPVLEVTAGAVSDSPQFPILLKRAIQNGFQFKEVYADKGYLSRENYNAAAELDVLPFIPFKSNNTGSTRGSPLYHKMFHFFQAERAEFDAHYGQRAQVESTFAQFKSKFGETLASRNFTAQENEIICLAIAHNISVLIRQMFEAGILPDFLRPPAGVGASETRPGMMVEPVLSLNQTTVESAVTLSAVPR